MPGYKRYVALAMLLLFAASIAVSTQNDTNTCKSASLENKSAGRPSITLVQEAANGTFVKNADRQLHTDSVQCSSLYHVLLRPP